MDLKMKELFTLYYPRLCYFAFQIVGDEAVAEDLVQDAFVRYWQNIDKIATDDQAVYRFLYVCVRNLCYNHLKRRQVVRRWEGLREMRDHEDPVFVNHIIRSEVIAEVHRIMEQMPAACRQIFEMSYLEGIPNSIIAEKLSISINTVKTQKQRGIRFLRKKISPEFYVILLATLPF